MASTPKKREFLADIAAHDDAEIKQGIRNMTSTWTFFGLGNTISFECEELVKKAQMKLAAVESLLGWLSLGFGDISGDTYLPEPVHLLKRRPLVEHGGQYLCPSPSLTLPAIRRGLESFLQGEKAKLWHRYEQHRHRLLLDRSLRCLAQLMPGCETYRELEYSTTENGQHKQAELDGFIKYGSVLFLIEVKGRTLTDPAKRGAQKRLEKELARLVADAHAQCKRAKDYIVKCETAQFTTKDGLTTVQVQKSELTSIFLVTITLEPMGYITAQINASADLGCFEGGLGEYPWMVSLFDLMAIAEIIDEPFVFPHYVKSRVRLGSETSAEAVDELDYFGHYLHVGLDYRTKDAVLQITAATDELDAYLYNKHGIPRGKARKPRARVSPGIRRLLMRLAKSKSPERVEVALALLDTPEIIQKEFPRKVEMCDKKRKRDGRAHNITEPFGGESAWGITYVTCDGKVEDRLREYCVKKLSQFRAKVWYGVGWSGRNGDHLVAVAVKSE